MSTNITEVTKVVGATGATATRVLSSAGGLAEQFDTLQQQVEAFLSAIRAA